MMNTLHNQETDEAKDWLIRVRNQVKMDKDGAYFRKWFNVSLETSTWSNIRLTLNSQMPLLKFTLQ